MRRALLTATGAVAPSFTVGTIPVTDANGTNVRGCYTTGNPAGGTGTLTTGTVKITSAASIYFFTVNPATLTVRAVSAVISAAAGLGTYPISLPVVAGDYIGVAGDSGTISIRRTSSGTFQIGTTSKPTVGASVNSYGNSTGVPWLQAST